MIEYLKKKIEPIIDSIVDPVVKRILTFSWKLKLTTVIVLSLGIFAITEPDVFAKIASVSVKTVKYTLSSNRIILNNKALERLQSSRRILWASLESLLESKHDPQLTPWVAAQLAWAHENTDTAFNSKLQLYFRQTKVTECGCWREIPFTEKSPRLVHVSGWVLSAMAKSDISATDDEITFLLQHQSESGWWPMYVISNVNDSNASTYTTAWALIGLSAQLAKKNTNPRFQVRMNKAIAKGAAWLMRTRADAARWKDYPLSEVGQVSESISGLVFHALTVTNNTSDTDLPEQWISTLPNSIPTPDAVEQSAILTDTVDGPQTDYYLQFKLPWMLIATIDALPGSKTFKKVEGSQWIERAVLQEGIRKMERDPLPWKRAELLGSLKYLSSVLNSAQIN